MPSIPRRSQTRTGDIRGAFGEDMETDLLSMKVQFPSLSREYRASVFDIVTVEVEGCLAAGWEEMSEGSTERRTDGNSGDVSDDMAFAGLPRLFQPVLNISRLEYI